MDTVCALEYICFKHIIVGGDQNSLLHVQLYHRRSKFTRFASFYLAEYNVTVLKRVIDVITDKLPSEMYQYPRHYRANSEERHKASDITNAENP